MESREPDIADEMDELLGGAPVAFQFTDLKAMAARILRRANEIAQQKLAAADRHVKEVERAAQEDGFRKGYDEGHAKGEAEGRAQGEAAAREAFGGAVEGVVPALKALVHELDEDRIRLQTQAEADLLLLAMEVARRVVRQAIAVDEDAVRPVLRDAIALMTMRNDLMVRVHPEDLAAVEAELPELRALFTDLGRVDVVADGGVERGGVRVMGRDGEVDLRIEEQLNALERALIGERVEAHGHTAAVSDTPPMPQRNLDQTARQDVSPATDQEMDPALDDDAAKLPGNDTEPHGIPDAEADGMQGALPEDDDPGSIAEDASTEPETGDIGGEGGLLKPVLPELDDGMRLDAEDDDPADDPEPDASDGTVGGGA